MNTIPAVQDGQAITASTMLQASPLVVEMHVDGLSIGRPCPALISKPSLVYYFSVVLHQRQRLLSHTSQLELIFVLTQR